MYGYYNYISKCGKKLDPHRLILTLTDTIKLKQE